MTPSTSASEHSKSSGAVVRPSPLVIAARLLLLCAAGLALVSAFRLAHARDRDRLTAEQNATERYVCPMHPEVISRVPGECPICRMALERAGADKGTADLERSGTIDTVARRVVTQLVRVPAWLATDGTVIAVLHKDDLVGLTPGEHGLFFGTSTPGVGTAVRLSPDPPDPWDAATVRLRFTPERAGATDPARKKKDTGWLQLSARPRELLVVPASAVLYSGTGAYVLAAPAGGHTFTRRDVALGRILDSGYGAGLVDDRFGTIVVLSGLAAGEQVIGGDAFFLDAERRLQASHGNPAEVTR
jgi:hypothetical protein